MKSIKRFKHINARTLDEASSSLRLFEDRAMVMAGGTDVPRYFEIRGSSNLPRNCDQPQEHSWFGPYQGRRTAF